MTTLVGRPERATPTDRRPGQLDWVLLGCVGTLVVLGSLLVLSASRHGLEAAGEDPASLLRRHVLNAVVGAVLAAVVVLAGWRAVRSTALVWWTGSVVALLVVLSPLGSTVNGARSWIDLPAGFSLQPAELAKVGLVLVLAGLLGSARPGSVAALVPPDPHPRGPDARQVGLALVAAAVPTGLVLLQPDLGSVVVLVAIAGAMLVVAGVRARWLAGLAIAAAVVVAAALRLGLLRDYQLARFLVFANPEVDPLGVGYNAAQARAAIGSGGLSGTGLFAGPLTGGGFVPEQETDFVFTVAGEELGFLGAALVVVVVGVLLWRVLRIGARSTDLEGRLVAAGVAGWFGFQAFQNIGMALGLVPVTGLPLPFVSYGGSSMFASMIAVGVLQAVAARPARAFGTVT